MKPLITVFTPTFNREKYLRRVYESLLRQSDRRFVWLVVDDGSTDSTRDAVAAFAANENGFEIKYCHKKNGGLHTAYNRAIELCETLLFVCVDSDDILTDNAVSSVLSHLNEIKSSDTAGFVAPNALPDGNLIGGALPNADNVHIGELKYRYHHRGDVKMIYKTDVLREFAPMPVYDGEKTFNPVYLFMRADEKYTLAVLREPVSVIDYSTNGMHTEVFAAYESSPQSFAELRRQFMRDRFAPPYAVFRNAIHYVSSCIFAKEKHMLKKSPRPTATFFALPFGVALNIFIRIKNKGARL